MNSNGETRSVLVEMKRSMVLAYADVPCVNAIYARVEKDSHRVSVHVIILDHLDDYYEAAREAESTLDALFPSTLFCFHNVVLQNRRIREVAAECGLLEEHRVY